MQKTVVLTLEAGSQGGKQKLTTPKGMLSLGGSMVSSKYNINSVLSTMKGPRSNSNMKQSLDIKGGKVKAETNHSKLMVGASPLKDTKKGSSNMAAVTLNH